MKLTPPRKTTLAPHGQNAKSIVYSPDRLLYPMKRVDFDPNGERNPQNRGKSGYVRISWEEALDLVADEIKRMKRDHGPGAIAVSHGSHHTWGNIGYYLSALYRFANAVGMTRVHHNPDCWEGWYWGAVHHWGHTLRVGQSETYGTVEDCLQNCDMIVFWAADPESPQAPTARRKAPCAGSGSKTPSSASRSSTSIRITTPPRNSCPANGSRRKPTTSVAMAMAIAYVWIKEGLYDKDYVKTHTVGFDKWKAYLARRRGRHREDAGMAGEGNRRSGQGRARARPRMGQEARLSRARRLGQRPRRRLPQPDRHPVGARDGVPRRRCRGWASPASTWATCNGARPLDFNFYFPGYADGGMSGDLENTSMPVELYQRMPQLPTHEHAVPAHPAHLRAGGDHRRQGRRLSAGSANRSSTSSRSSAIRRPAIRR